MEELNPAGTTISIFFILFFKINQRKLLIKGGMQLFFLRIKFIDYTVMQKPVFILLPPQVFKCLLYLF